MALNQLLLEIINLESELSSAVLLFFHNEFGIESFSMKIGIVIPACNVGGQLRGVLLKCLQYVSKNHIYVIDDGSTDLTSDVAKKGRVVIHRHPGNLGKGAALKTGFKLALSDRLEGIFTMDGDGQHDPDSIPAFLSVMRKTGCDFVMGTRRFRISEMPADRIFSNRMSSLVVSLLVGRAIHDSQCGFRLIRRNVIESIELNTNHYETETELLVKAIWNGFRIGFCSIPVISTIYESQIRRLPDSVRFCRLILKLLQMRI